MNQSLGLDIEGESVTHSWISELANPTSTQTILNHILKRSPQGWGLEVSKSPGQLLQTEGVLESSLLEVPFSGLGKMAESVSCLPPKQDT